MPEQSKHQVISDLVDRFKVEERGVLAAPEADEDRAIRQAKELACLLLGAAEIAARAAEAVPNWEQVEKWAEKIGDANIKQLVYLSALDETLKALSGPATAFTNILTVVSFLGRKLGVLQAEEQFEVRAAAPTLTKVLESLLARIKQPQV